MPLDAIRYALRGGLWSFAADLAGVHLAALVLRGSAREFDVLLSAMPRDVLLSHPELAGALAGARIMQGAGTEVEELMTAASNGVHGLAGQRGRAFVCCSTSWRWVTPGSRAGWRQSPRPPAGSPTIHTRSPASDWRPGT